MAGGAKWHPEWRDVPPVQTPASAEFVFFDGTDLWEEVTKQHGRSILESVLKIKHIPEDPSVN